MSGTKSKLVALQGVVATKYECGCSFERKTTDDGTKGKVSLCPEHYEMFASSPIEEILEHCIVSK